MHIVSSVADPEFGIGFFRIPDLGSRIPNPLMTNFSVRSTIIVRVLAEKIVITCSKIKLFSIFMIFVAKKNNREKK